MYVYFFKKWNYLKYFCFLVLIWNQVLMITDHLAVSTYKQDLWFR